MPEVGSQRNTTEKRKMSMMASQKLGIDWPSTATTRTVLSTHVLRFTAAVTPRAMPITVLNASAGAPNNSELGNLSAISRATSPLSAIDLPRLPLTALVMNTQYCTGTG